MYGSTRVFSGLAASLAVVLALVLAPMGSAATTGSATYTDPSGDAKSAPDVANVTLGLDAASGALAVDVQFAADDQLAGDAGVFVLLNTDRNSGTGDRTGAEYVVGVSANAAGLLKWNGSDVVPFNHLPIAVSRSARDVRVIFCTCDIGTQSFDFAVVSARGADIDVAPDTGGTFPIPEQTITIQSFVYSPKPVVPKAGKRFTLKPLGIRLAETNEVVAPDSLACTAKLAGKSLKGTGVGGCSWLLPKKARGTKLVVSVNVSYQGEKETFTQTFKVT